MVADDDLERGVWQLLLAHVHHAATADIIHVKGYIGLYVIIQTTV